MDAWLNRLSPYVRMVKIVNSSTLSGEWIDYDHVFTYIEQGEAEFILNGIKYLAKEGDVFLMQPLLSHIIRTTSSVPLIQYIVHFDLHYDEERAGWKETSLMNETTRRLPERERLLGSTPPVSSLRSSDQIELKKRFLMMHKLYLDEKEYGGLILKGYCIELLYLYLKSLADWSGREGKLTKGWAMIEKAIRYINNRYRDPELDNDAIAGHVGITANHLSFLFKDQIHVTMHKYLTHVRIEQAKLKIIEGKLTLTAIAEETGYKSIHMFSRAFKTAVGITPSQFTAANANIHNYDS